MFFSLAADAFAVHMRITLNFWGNILSRRWAVGSLPLDSAPSGGRQTRSPTVKETHAGTYLSMKTLCFIHYNCCYRSSDPIQCC